MRLGVLASGAGTNLQAILDRLHGHEGIEVAAVGSDQPAAQALERARRAGVPTAVFPRAGVFTAAPPAPAGEPPGVFTAAPPATVGEPPGVSSREDRDAAMAAWLAERDVDLVVLAGYMRILTPAFLARFPRRVINIHPALLPAFPGLHAIEQAVEHGVKVFGATVHFVDEGVDSGPIIAQRALELPGTPTAAEVREALRPLEHDLLCEVVRALAAGAVEPDPADPRRIAYRPAPMGGGR